MSVVVTIQDSQHLAKSAQEKKWPIVKVLVLSNGSIRAYGEDDELLALPAENVLEVANEAYLSRPKKEPQKDGKR